MSTILLIEDVPNLGLYEAGLLEAAGHRVLRCGGRPTPLSACPLLRTGTCPVADAADLIVFACGPFAPIRGCSYRGAHLLSAYRAHPRYGRLPMLVVGYGMPMELEGTGPVRWIDPFAGPGAVLREVAALGAGRSANGPPRARKDPVGAGRSARSRPAGSS